MTDKIDISGRAPSPVVSEKGEQPHQFGLAQAAGKVRNPDRNIPRATVLGTIATAVVHMLSLTVVFGIVPTPKLASATAPFSGGALGRAGT